MIAPKGLARFTPDNEEIDELKDGFVVDVSLRDPHFEWSTGKLVNGDLSYRMKNDEWPIFVKQGSILTTMNVHDEDKKCLSLEDCWGNSITVKIYGEEASGHLYLDDGISLPV
jgi:alpha-glucosidase (family GH31 glycosyl hydrolase)